MIAARTSRAASSMCLILQLNLWESLGEALRRSNLTSCTKWGAARQGEASRPPERDQGTSALGRAPFCPVPVRDIPASKFIDVIGTTARKRHWLSYIAPTRGDFRALACHPSH